MDAAVKTALKDLAKVLVDKELGPLLEDLVSKLPVGYESLASIIERAALPAIQLALDAEIDKI